MDRNAAAELSSYAAKWLLRETDLIDRYKPDFGDYKLPFGPIGGEEEDSRPHEPLNRSQRRGDLRLASIAAGMQNKQFSGVFTSREVRFTTNKRTLYALFMGWSRGEVTIEALARNRLPTAWSSASRYSAAAA